MKNIKNVRFAILCLYVILILSGCKKLIEIDPPIDKITGNSVFSDPASAAKVLTGIYYDMSVGGSVFAGSNSLSVRLAYASDELVDVTESDPYYKNALSAKGDVDFWIQLYKYIFRANAAIEGISTSDALSAKLKSQLLGEAKFIRALNYFYLINLYGDVPLLLTTDYTVNALSPRKPKAEIYAQIINDLKEAKLALSADYLGGNAQVQSSQRTRPNQNTASALLARVYLYTEDWQKAEAESSLLISQSDKYALDIPESNFLFNSREAIWQLETAEYIHATADALYFIPGIDRTELSFHLSPALVSEFSSPDLRKSNNMMEFLSTGLYYPYKYKSVSDNPIGEYLMVFRLSEQYLIRAEARANQGKLAGSNSAKSDVDAVRLRSGLSASDAVTKDEILDVVMEERRLELFTEWGHRWFDLKRTGRIDDVLKNAKGIAWQSTDQLLPIPNSELQKDKNLIQNPGY